MEIDPEFEFECPKWVDFEDEDQEMNEENFAEGLDDAWFEKEHPLHEPKDKDKKELELRPLIEPDSDNKATRSTTTKTSAKSKNPKKSLGFKKSVTMQRREKRRILPEIANKINQGEKRKNADDGEDNEFCQRDFSSSSIGDLPPSRRKDNSVQGSSPVSSLMHSPLRGNIASPLKTNSTKQSLFTKTASNIDGHRKRRHLPTIPIEVPSTQGISTLLPQRAHSAPDQTGFSKSKPLDFSPRRLDTCAKPMNSIQQKYTIKTTELENKDNNLSAEKLLKLHNQKVMASKCKYDSNGRRIKSENTTTVEQPVSGMCSSKHSRTSSNENRQKRNKPHLHKEQKMTHVDKKNMNAGYTKIGQHVNNEDNQSQSTIGDKSQVNSDLNSTYVCEDNVEIQLESEISGATAKLWTTNKEEKMSNKYSTSRSSDENIVSKHEVEDQDRRKTKDKSEDLSIEDLLKQHNKKVMATKCKYDSNGRRIQTANPVFCPAPSQAETSKKRTLTRTTSEKLSEKTTARERPSSRNDYKSKKKHLRRSYAAAPSNKVTTKQKRRSCFTATSSKNEGDDEELKNLVARHNQILAKLK